MSIFSDYKVGALSEVEFHNACVEMNAQDRWEREFFFEPDFDDLESLDEEECENGEEDYD